MKTLLITGASSGIGLATVKKLLSQDYTVIGLSRTSPQINNNNFFFYPSDLTKKEELKKTLKKIRENHILDGIILNAGIALFSNLEEVSNQAIFELFEINLLSAISILSFFLKDLKKRGGEIIAIGSKAALELKKKSALYSATKSALRSFIHGLREEVKNSSLRVHLIEPGIVTTSFYKNSFFSPSLEEGAYLKPEEIADLISFILKLPSHIVLEEVVIAPIKTLIKKTKFDKVKNKEELSNVFEKGGLF